MSEERLARLLDQAIPSIPAGLDRPPLPELRAQIRRHRARRAAVAVGAVTAVLLTGPALWYQSTRDGAAPAPGGTPSAAEPTSTVAKGALTWWMARVGQDGKTVTLFVSRPLNAPQCAGTWRPEARAAEESDVTVTVTDRAADGAGCPPDDRLATVEVTLAKPLGARSLIDGYGNERRPVYLDSDLPRVPVGPGGWSEVPASFSGPTPGMLPGFWAISYTRPGGPDIHIRAYSVDHELARPPKAVPVATVRVSRYNANVYRYGPEGPGQSRFQVRWEGVGVVYTLTVLPNESEELTRARFDQVLSQIGIS